MHVGAVEWKLLVAFGLEVWCSVEGVTKLSILSIYQKDDGP